MSPKGPVERPSFGTLVRVFMRIGLLSFGGPAGQIALMHRELVDDRKWVSDARFLHALQYCTLIPGPEAQQLATYLGWLLHGTKGGLAAGLLFVIPGAIVLALLSALYVTAHSLPFVADILFGVKCAVLGIVIEALLRIGKRGLTTRLGGAIALASFIALFVLAVPFPIVVVSALLIGLVGSQLFPTLFPKPSGTDGASASNHVVDVLFERGELSHTKPSRARALRVLVVSALVFAIPFVLLYVVFGRSTIFSDQASLFGKSAFVTFGGAYAVLAYIAQDAVVAHGWLRPGEMMDGLGLAETTPGPLILVLEFVAFVSAYRTPEGLPPFAAGSLAALVMLWVTFVPCFFFIFVGAPYVEAVRGNARLHASLSSVTAAVVGVIANLTVFLAMHTLFANVGTVTLGNVAFPWPELVSLRPDAVLIAIVAAVALLRLHLGMAKTLAIAATLGVVARFL